MQSELLLNKIQKNEYKELIEELYQDKNIVEYHNNRYQEAVKKYEELFGSDDVEVISVSGRSEICGNHTDHQNGNVLAASINKDTLGVVAKQKDKITIVSDNYDIEEIDINDLEKKEEDKGTSVALIKGVVKRLQELGYEIGGFKAYITSDVLSGAGLSSSASFEGMIGTIISELYNDLKIDNVTISKVGQYAEREYFGKPCGLMDQCACNIGGLITIDFKDKESPIIEQVDVDFSKYNHSLCVIDTKASHADLTDDYAAIPEKMKKIANYFGKEVLREVNEEEFYKNIPKLRELFGERPVLRAMHFFKENIRVKQAIKALENDDFELFKKYIKESGESSFKLLQNIYSEKNPKRQNVTMALILAEEILKDNGVCRVHGGGFARTILAIVDNDFVEEFKDKMEYYFGKDSCQIIKIREKGATKVIK